MFSFNPPPTTTNTGKIFQFCAQHEGKPDETLKAIESTKQLYHNNVTLEEVSCSLQENRCAWLVWLKCHSFSHTNYAFVCFTVCARVWVYLFMLHLADQCMFSLEIWHFFIVSAKLLNISSFRVKTHKDSTNACEQRGNYNAKLYLNTYYTDGHDKDLSEDFNKIVSKSSLKLCHITRSLR